jgi:hypothetical protein
MMKQNEMGNKNLGATLKFARETRALPHSKL